MCNSIVESSYKSLDEYAVFTEMVVAREMADGEVGVFLSYAPIEIMGAYL